MIAARLGGDQHLSAAEVAVLGVEVAGQHAKVVDRIEIRYHGGSVVEVFFNHAAVHVEAVGRLALAAHRHVPGIQVAGGRCVGAAGHDDGIGLGELAGTTPGCMEMRSVKLRPFSGTVDILLAVMVSPTCVVERSI